MSATPHVSGNMFLSVECERKSQTKLNPITHAIPQSAAQVVPVDELEEVHTALLLQDAHERGLERLHVRRRGLVDVPALFF